MATISGDLDLHLTKKYRIATRNDKQDPYQFQSKPLTKASRYAQPSAWRDYSFQAQLLPAQGCHNESTKSGRRGASITGSKTGDDRFWDQRFRPSVKPNPLNL